jgi:DHA2 family multidrug resistance protein-like MFS transporter
MGFSSRDRMIDRGRLSLIAVLCAMSMVVLDTGMLIVALPTLSAAIHVDLAHGIWAVSAYQMALLVGLLPSAQLAGRFGQRKTLIVGLIIYLTASGLCAASPNLVLLVAARMLQGLGGAVIMALGISILRGTLGTEKLGRAIGWNALVVAMSSAAAPSLAAAILSIGNWPWLFLAKLPVGLVALAAASNLPRDCSARTSLDMTAIAIHTVIAATLLVAFERLVNQPLLAISGLALAAALSRWMTTRQTASGAPLWPMDLIADRGFRISVFASVFCFTGQTAGLIALPLLLQTRSGLSIADTALIMTCWPVSVALMAAISGRLADRFGSPALCAAGGAILSGGLMTSGLASLAGSVVGYISSAVLCGIGFGLFQVPNNRSLFLSAPVDRGAAAGGMQGSARLFGQTLGALLVGLLLGYFPAAVAATIAMAIGGVFAAGAALFSLTSLPRFVQRHHA